MESLLINLTYVLLFAYLGSRLNTKDYKQLCVSVKRYSFIFLMAAVFSSVLFVAVSYAQDAPTASPYSESGNVGLFSDLINKGAEIFKGVRDIVYVVSGFGIIGVAVGGFFGNLNWKWLGAIIIGLMVIAMTGGILDFVAGQENTISGIENTLK